MGKVSSMGKVKAALVAAALVMAFGFVALWGAQPALAYETQAGSADLTVQSNTPALSGSSKVTVAVGETKKVVVTDTVLGQTGTWKVTSSNTKIATVKPASQTVTAQSGITTQSDAPLTLTVSITGKKAGEAKVSVQFTTSKGKKKTKTITVTVKGAKKNATKAVSGVTYKVTNNTATPGKVTVKSAKNVKGTRTIPASVKINNKKYTVTGIGSKAFKNCTKTTTLKVKSTSLTKKAVKNSLKGSKITTVKVPKAKLKAYTKYFAKSNSGKKVTVKAY